MEQRCRPTHTSASGEILAAAGEAAVRQHDLAAAVRHFGAATDAFRKHNVPVPADVVCALASASLLGASTREARELAAQQADQCLRSSAPGLPSRLQVVQQLATLRIEGLDPAHFDAERPAAVFFTAEPEKPKVEAIEIEIDVPERDAPGFADLTAALRAPAVREGVSRCFLADWDKSRTQRAETTISLKLTTRMRDMGDYDAFEPNIEVATKTEPGASDTPFAGCVVGAVKGALGPGPKVNRVVSWEEQLRIVAHL